MWHFLVTLTLLRNSIVKCESMKDQGKHCGFCRGWFWERWRENLGNDYELVGCAVVIGNVGLMGNAGCDTE